MTKRARRNFLPEQIKAAEVEKQISELPEETLACRDLRHARSAKARWQVVEVTGGIRGAKYVERIVDCMRCPVYWRELFRVHDNWLERISSYPVYPKKGYLLHDIPKGVNVLAMVRFEQYQRVMKDLA